jgi:hypothetical protein
VPERHEMPTSPRVFNVGAASVDITPTVPLPLAGYGDRAGPYTRVADRLEANIAVFRQSETVVVFVSCDLLFVGPSLRGRLEALLADLVAAESLFVSATHTHFAPATNLAIPRLGQASHEYVEKVALDISAMVRSLLATASPMAVVEQRSGYANSAIHRRLPVTRLRFSFPPWGRRWEMRPNEAVAVDNRIRVLTIETTDGRPVAVCWSYACHPVCYPDKTHVSADFPGVVREAIRTRLGNIPVLFWQGFSGDVRPRSLAASELPAFGAFTTEQWRGWSEGLAASVLEAMQASGETLAGRLAVGRRQLALTELGLNGGNRNITIHEVRLGDSLEVFGISAEPVNAYVAKLEAARPGSTVIPVGCIDDVICYLPTDEMVVQGGYEVTGFRKLFGVSGRFRRGIEARIEREFQPIGT